MKERMNRRRLVFGVCAGVLAVLLLACAGTAAGATRVVDDGGMSRLLMVGVEAGATRQPRNVYAKIGSRNKIEGCECNETS